MFNVECLIYHTNQKKKKEKKKKRESHTIAIESGKEAQKETMGLIDIGLPQSIK